MTLPLPSFTELDSRVSADHINHSNTLTVGQLRKFFEDRPDDAIVWLATNGKNSPVRPSQSAMCASGYVLIS